MEMTCDLMHSGVAMDPTFTCDGAMDGITYKQMFLNAGCCSTISKPPECDMDKLTTDAATYDECAAALANEFESKDESCACWNAMGEEYRTANFNCLADGNYATVNEMYAANCASDETESTESPEEQDTSESPEEESTQAPEEQESTEAPVEDKKVVKFDMTLNGMSKTQYDANKAKVKDDIAAQLDTTASKITVTVKSRRARRMLTESVELEVAVNAADDAAATAITNKVKEESFKSELATKVEASTGVTVTVEGVSEPTSEALTTAESDDSSSSNTTMIIIIVVAIVVVLMIGGFVCYTMSNNDKLAKEVGGGEVGETETKRTPDMA